MIAAILIAWLLLLLPAGIIIGRRFRRIEAMERREQLRERGLL